MTLSALPGSPAAIADTSRDLASRSTVLDDAAGRVAQVRGPLLAERTTAAVGATERLAEVHDGAKGVAQLLRAAGAALASFGSRLSEQQLAAGSAAERYADAIARRARWAAEEDQLELEVVRAQLARSCGAADAGSHGRHEHELYGRLELARRERRRAQEDASSAEAQHRGVVAAHEEESRRTAVLLAMLTDTQAVRAWALAEPGGTLESFAAARAAGLAAGALATSMAALPASESGFEGKELGDSLVRALHKAGSDPVFWAAFWSSTNAGEVSAAAARYVPAVFRNGAGGSQAEWPRLLALLATGTAAWAGTHTSAERLAFGRRAVGALDAEPDTAPEVLAAMLGARPPTTWDGIGRPTANPTTATRPAPGAGKVTAADAAMAEVAAGVLIGFDDNLGDDKLSDQEAPAAAAALGVLSRDPAAALEYLAAPSSALLDERAQRWLGARVAWPDAGAGVTAAFATAALAGAVSPSRLGQARGAQLVSRATTAMPAGLLGGATVLADAAERDVARAYRFHLGAAGDLSARTRADGTIAPDPASASADVLRPGTRADAPAGPNLGAVPQPVQADVDLFRLREIVARSSATELGAATWLADVTEHEDEVLEFAFPEGGDLPGPASQIEDRQDQTAAVQDSLRDAGTVAGAIQVDDVRQAAIVEAQRGLVVDAIATVVAAPVSAQAGALAGAATQRVASDAVRFAAKSLAQAATDQGVTMGGELLKNLADHEVWDAKQRLSIAEDETRRPFVERAHDAAVAWSVARGASAQEAASTWDHLEPENVTVAEPFNHAYRIAADPSTGVDPVTGGPLDPERP